MIIDGNAIAAEIKAAVRAEVERLRAARRAPVLASVQVGDNTASEIYVRSQRRGAEEVGIEFRHVRLPGDAPVERVLETIDGLNADPRVTGVLLQLPLPPGFPMRRAQLRIAPDKDVEGVNPQNLGLVVYGEANIAPCTALGVLEILDRIGVDARGAEAVMVGHSDIVGKPVALGLLDRMATVTVCHVATRDLAAHTRRADVLVVAVGKPRLITAPMVKRGAVVIDVGINRVDDAAADGTKTARLVGDVDFDAVKDVAGWVTPVPGGAGPVTVAMVLRNAVLAARKAIAARE